MTQIREKKEVKGNSYYMQECTDAFDAMRKHTSDKIAEAHLIGLLQRVSGYFQDEFTEEEIDRMQYNIKMDFPIFLETCVGGLQEKVANLQSQIASMEGGIAQRNTLIDEQQEEIKGLESRMRTILHNLVSVEISSDNCIQGALGQFSRIAIIMEKLNQGIALDAEELRVVQSKITNY